MTTVQKRRNYIIVGITAVIAVAFIGFSAWQGAENDTDDTQAAAKTTETATTPAEASSTTQPRSTYATQRAQTQPRTTTAAAPSLPPAQLPAASTPQEAGCEDPDPSIVMAIEVAITEGRVLRDVAAVTDTVNGLEYEYFSGNVFEADGTTRSVSGVVWLSPGLGVVNLSSNSREVTPEFMFGRGIYGNAGDDAGIQVQDCVAALFRGR